MGPGGLYFFFRVLSEAKLLSHVFFVEQGLNATMALGALGQVQRAPFLVDFVAQGLTLNSEDKNVMKTYITTRFNTSVGCSTDPCKQPRDPNPLAWSSSFDCIPAENSTPMKREELNTTGHTSSPPRRRTERNRSGGEENIKRRRRRDSLRQSLPGRNPLNAGTIRRATSRPTKEALLINSETS